MFKNMKIVCFLVVFLFSTGAGARSFYIEGAIKEALNDYGSNISVSGFDLSLDRTNADIGIVFGGEFDEALPYAERAFTSRSNSVFLNWIDKEISFNGTQVDKREQLNIDSRFVLGAFVAEFEYGELDYKNDDIGFDDSDDYYKVGFGAYVGQYTSLVAEYTDHIALLSDLTTVIVDTETLKVKFDHFSYDDSSNFGAHLRLQYGIIDAETDNGSGYFSLYGVDIYPQTNRVAIKLEYQDYNAIDFFDSREFSAGIEVFIMPFMAVDVTYSDTESKISNSSTVSGDFISVGLKGRF